jgi:sulfite reductase beta subunit
MAMHHIQQGHTYANTAKTYLVANVCERPTVVARCPVAAIRPAMVNGKPQHQ